MTMEAVSQQGELFRGIGVSPGVATGPVALLRNAGTPDISERLIAESDIASETARFEEALIETRRQIRQIQEQLSRQTRGQDASILDAHLMVLDDRTFLEEVIGAVRDKLRNIELAVREGTDRYASVLEAVEDDYLRERVADVRDVGKRILRNLTGAPSDTTHELAAGHLIVAHDLAPSETAALPKDRILGFATDIGSPTSHTAVMARALELPAVVGLRDISRRVKTGDQVLIDGNKGVFIINPTDEQLKTYGKQEEARRSIEAGLGTLLNEPAETRDGHAIILSANAEGPEDLDAVLSHGACGIGLLRSEFMHLTHRRILTEDEQSAAYDRIAVRLAPSPVIIRTLDLGGDKFFGDTQSETQANPFLGLRSIRLSLHHPDYFKQQLRAILRASVHQNVKIMYPMISCVDELLQANYYLDEVKQELDHAGVAFDRDIDVGCMIEVPAAALSAATLAKHVDFFSIGTNDLIQYTIAVDRGNERVAYLYQPTHPSVLRMIQLTVEAAHANDIWVGICGEMAADPMMTALLVGLGLDELSVTPRAVPLVKDAVRGLTLPQAVALAEEALNCDNAGEVLEKCRELTRTTAPEIMSLIE